MAVIGKMGMMLVLLPLLAAAGSWPIVVVPSAYGLDEEAKGRGDCVDYQVKTPFPASAVRHSIGQSLEGKGFRPLRFDYFSTTRVTLATQWQPWETKREQWQNARGDTLEYRFNYGGQREILRVNACYLTAEELQHMVHYRVCPENKGPVADTSEHAAVRITRIEPWGDKDYRVFVSVKNPGEGAVFLETEGQQEDGCPKLSSLGIQQQEDGDWEYVGGAISECLCPPSGWITLGPGEEVETWAAAIDLPAPNTRIGMIIRKVGHLHGSVRAGLKYYTSACHLQNRLKATSFLTAASDTVPLPTPR